jgi:GTP pyrophosphokinase
MPLRTELKSGDQVEIITAPSARPNPSWLNFVATGKARSRIRHFLKTLQQRESAALGERMLEQALASLKASSDSITAERWDALMRDYGAKTRLDVLADIGLGKRLSFVVAQTLTRANARIPDDAPPGSQRPGALQLRGVEGVAIQYSKCCRPIPGDAIVGQFRRGQGLSVHTRDCQTLRKGRVDTDQVVDVEWAPEVTGVFEAGVRLLVDDQRGLLARLATEIADAGANIEYVSMERPDGDHVVNMFFSVQVRDRRHLAHVMRALRRIQEVRRVHRART